MNLSRTSEHCVEIVDKLLAQKLGKISFEELPESEQNILNLFIRIGCGGHKDLNAFKYGAEEMKATWVREGLTGPVKLPNKTLESVIKIATENGDTSKSFCIHY